MQGTIFYGFTLHKYYPLRYIALHPLVDHTSWSSCFLSDCRVWQKLHLFSVLQKILSVIKNCLFISMKWKIWNLNSPLPYKGASYSRIPDHSRFKAYVQEIFSDATKKKGMFLNRLEEIWPLAKQADLCKISLCLHCVPITHMLNKPVRSSAQFHSTQRHGIKLHKKSIHKSH